MLHLAYASYHTYNFANLFYLIAIFQKIYTIEMKIVSKITYELSHDYKLQIIFFIYYFKLGLILPKHPS